MANGCFGLFGTGGCARSIMPFVPAALSASLGPMAADLRIVFVDRTAGPDVNLVPVMSEAEFLAQEGPRYFNIGVADGILRRTLAERAVAAGAKPVTLIAPSAQVLGYGELGEGAILCPQSIVTVNAKIGRFAQLNLFAYVEHDCVVGDFVTFAPRSSCNGNVEIGDGAYIGTGAILRQGKPGKPLRIGAGAVVGMGAVVTRDVAAGITVIGCPARPMLKRKDRSQ
jgi:sugar O-acyltransferase (sialic acid O-acetyltransferase NeuD family)